MEIITGAAAQNSVCHDRHELVNIVYIEDIYFIVEGYCK